MPGIGPSRRRRRREHPLAQAAREVSQYVRPARSEQVEPDRKLSMIAARERNAQVDLGESGEKVVGEAEKYLAAVDVFREEALPTARLNYEGQRVVERGPFWNP